MSTQIVEYKVLTASTEDSLTAKVNKKISEGYQPMGHIVIHPTQYTFIQAVVKYKALVD